MKKILIVSLISILVIVNLTGCKSEGSSNHTDKKDITKIDLEKENKNNKDDKNYENNSKDRNEDKKGSGIMDYLTGDSFDAATYVESCLDLLTKGETEFYIKMTKRTKEQAEEDYQNNIYAIVEGMGISNLSAQLQEDYAEFFKELYKKSKYNVKGSEKMSDRDGYTVTIEIEQITGLFDNLEEELSEEIGGFITDETSSEDINEIAFQVMLDLMNKRLDKITYNVPKIVIIDVVADNNHVYNITNQGYEAINEALISTNGL